LVFIILNNLFYQDVTDFAVALRVTKQAEHKVDGVLLKIVLREMSPSVLSQAISVKGIKQEIHSKEYISLYFENSKSSRGGLVDNIFLDIEHDSAIVTFTEPQSKKFNLIALY